MMRTTLPNYSSSKIAISLLALTLWCVCTTSTAFSPTAPHVQPSIRFSNHAKGGTTARVLNLPFRTRTTTFDHYFGIETPSLDKGQRRQRNRNQNHDGIVILAASTTASSDLNDEADGSSDDGSNKPAETTTTKKAGIRQRISSYFKGSDKDDGLTFKERLAKMGLATVLSYGFVSNVNSMILTVCSWYVFSLRTKMSPLWPGQWKPFLGVYAGFYVISNLMRPLRVTAAIAIGPYFDRLVNFVQQKTKLPKAVSVTATVVMVNLVGTSILFIGGILLASLLSGVSIYPPRP